MNEQEFQTLLTDHLAERYSAECHKLAGSLYQAGMPDWAISIEGRFIMIETKVLWQKTPRLDQLVNALRPIQRSTFGRWTRQANHPPAYIAAWTPAGGVFASPEVLPKALQDTPKTELRTYPSITHLAEAIVSHMRMKEYPLGG